MSKDPWTDPDPQRLSRSPPHTPGGGGHTSRRSVLGLAFATSKDRGLRPCAARSDARQLPTRGFGTASEPGDFDEFLASIDPRDPRYVEVHEGNPDAKVTVLPAGMDAEDARRLAELAVERGKTMGEVLAELVRGA